MNNELHEDYVDAANLEDVTRQIMAEQGVGRHQAHIMACRVLGLTEAAPESTQRPGIPNRLVGLALAGLLLLAGIGPAFAGGRDNFPDNRCPGSGCPDNAQPKAAPDDGRGSGR